MTRAVLTWAATAAVIGALAPAANAQTPAEVNFGVISTEAVDEPEEELGAVPAGDGEGHRLQGQRLLCHRLCRRHRGHALRQGPGRLVWQQVGMEAVDRANGAVFLQIVAHDGSPGYYSHIIVHKDSALPKLDDILKCDKSLDFGIGDPNSTSGFLVPTSYIFAARNIDPKSCFKTVRNANHQANAMAVANKQVAAATNNSEDLAAASQNSAPDARSRIKIIWTSPLIPLDPVRVAQGPRSGRQEQALHLPDELRPHRLGRRDQGRQGRPRRSALGSVPAVIRPSAAADPHPRGQQEPDEGSGRRQAFRRREEQADRGHPRRHRASSRRRRRRPRPTRS